MQISRDNHFVPRLYLRNWENDRKINIYNLIVPNDNVPIWVSKPSKSIALQKDLYIRIEEGKELDDFEEDFCQRFEAPAKPCLDKIVNDEKLSANEWTVVTDYVTAQFVRTPAFLLYANECAEKIIPEALDTVLDRLINEYPKRSNLAYISEKKIIPTEIKLHANNSGNNKNSLEVSVVNGKGVWLSIMEYLLADGSNLRRLFRDMKWSIIKADKDCTWPTTDNPVAVYNKNTHHIGIENGLLGKAIQIIFPISPKKVLLSSYYREYGWKYNADYDF